MYWTDDPLADFDRHDRAQARALARLPRCCVCKERIQSEYCYELDGEYICEDCIEEVDDEEVNRVYTKDVEGE